MPPSAIDSPARHRDHQLVMILSPKKSNTSRDGGISSRCMSIRCAASGEIFCQRFAAEGPFQDRKIAHG